MDQHAQDQDLHQNRQEFALVDNGDAPEDDARRKPDAALDPAGEVGWYLEQERRRRGYDIEGASEVTGIHSYHIFAIEHGDMTHMPSRIEALEMVGNYANFLGFDPEPLLQHYVTLLPQPQLAPKNHPAAPAPLSSAKIMKFGKFAPRIKPIDLKSLNLPKLSNLPGGQNGIVASVAAAFILLTGTVWMMSGKDDPFDQAQVEQVTVAPPTIDQAANQTAEAVSPDASSDPMPTATTGSESAAVTVTETPVETTSIAKIQDIPATEEPDMMEQPSATTLQAEQSEAAVQNPDELGAFIQKQIDGEPTAQAMPVPALETPAVQVAAAEPQTEVANTGSIPEAKVFGSEDPNARLVLRAQGPVWVRVEDANNRVLMTQMLYKGDMYRVPDQSGLSVIAKDGGLLSYIIDGKERGVLGLPGKILAGQSLDIKVLDAKG